MKKTTIFLFITLIIGISIWFTTINKREKNIQITPTKKTSTTLSNIPSQKINQNPILLKIPKINLKANIEPVGNDEKGNMAVPEKSENVSWYKLGYKPGDPGNAVMAGHLDKKSGAPAVFWNLQKLDIGDKIITITEDKEEHIFSITKKINYPYNNFPIKEVFGPANQSMLNLITCQGDWNSQTENYSHRTVIFSKLDQ